MVANAFSGGGGGGTGIDYGGSMCFTINIRDSRPSLRRGIRCYIENMFFSTQWDIPARHDNISRAKTMVA